MTSPKRGLRHFRHRHFGVAVDSGARNARYDEALEIPSAIGSLRTKLRERAEFSRELEEIRENYRAKRNFNKLLATLS
ncbi:hypothetical protein CNECB9_2200025 [Cupriavidus necator]|uniref:Uncharacterized protein n=1 Tax=Cupriavidus necator TaxID=106590 RepID=A0A1K0JII9_CUPNE|nr:hypothetical protein CNECB9_2200025 [Cupriavidus necator]